MLVYTRPRSAPRTAQAELAGDEPGGHQPLEDSDTERAPIGAEHQPEPHRMFHPEPDRMFHPVPQPPTTTVRRRRPITVTRQLAADMLADEPNLSREQIAARLGVSTRRLRAVLASAPNAANGTRSRLDLRRLAADDSTANE
jgi:hypothetical protein